MVSDLAVDVGEQRKVETVLLGELRLEIGAVHGDADGLGAESFELGR